MITLLYGLGNIIVWKSDDAIAVDRSFYGVL